MHIEEELKKKTGPLALSISALGVVYGDIGTSPLYALKETCLGTHPLARNPENVLGILSLVFWTILLVVGINHLFYALFPQHDGILYSVVILSTMATVIASQALISGAFSMTRQGVALGFFPRMLVRFTSAEIEGQICIPAVNWLLVAGCIFLVMGFQTLSALAAAYGIAVTATMAITSFITATLSWPETEGSGPV